ncbi:Gfo/Idh/MocA family oxidoreductase [Iodobacter sp. LRB]|uniref:Gfo/Idh/MocA family protein n=1 Tax=unclassified Iodobacter TaxID=235634 RepID=UPI000C0CC0D3|nr:Gfo/Idh/MocA family oxidoreductase [Iodobacter sp. BJB302]PHV03279.1 oxidoreductase [Iodobacter sp. BJB302]
MTIRFGIIGTGHIANRFAQGLAVIAGEARLAAVWNRNQAKASAFAEQYGGVVYQSVDDLLASDIDAVYIATPHTSHVEYSIAAMKAGKAVLCEKPAATSLAELERVLDVATETGQLFMEAMKPGFYPLYQALREHLSTDPIGQVAFVRCGFANPNVAADHAVLKPSMAGGGLLDIGIYGAFLAVDWLGGAQAVQALGRLNGGVDTFASINSQHSGGISQLYCGLDLAGSGEAMLAGPDGHVVLDEKWWNPTAATIFYKDGRKVRLEAPPVGSGLQYETAHFCHLLTTGQSESSLMPYAHSRAMIAMMDAARAELGLVYPFEVRAVNQS